MESYDLLVEELNHHCHLYHTLGNPDIDDAEYDLLFKELQRRESTMAPADIRLDSPTRRVGSAPLSEFKKVSHPIPLLSLSNAFNDDDIVKFDADVKKGLERPESSGIEYVCEPKIDGLALKLVYINGFLTEASTRGDGEVGEDVTLNARTIRDIPLQLLNDPPPYLEVRGEAYLKKSQLAEINATADKPFKNCRNAATGSIRQLDSTICAKRKLSFYVYTLGELKGDDIRSQQDFMFAMVRMGFKVSPLVMITKGVRGVREMYDYMMEQRDSLDYEIDGMVVKVNSFESQEKLGMRTRDPRHAIAYKFPSKKALSEVLAITNQVGRTGAVTPVAELTPTELCGVTVSRATLHNYEEIAAKDIRVGDVVIIERAGDVIPAVVRVVEHAEGSAPTVMPTNCPVCNSLLVKEEDKTVLKCINLDCAAQLVQKLSHFVSKAAMNIDGLSEKTVETLIDCGLVSAPDDFYRLTRESLRRQAGFGNTTITNLVGAIEKSKETTLSRLIYALGIPLVGVSTAKLLARTFPTIESLINDTHHEALTKLPDIGDTTAIKIYTWFDTPGNIDLLLELQELGITYTVEQPKEGKLVGESVCFTGSISMPRLKAQALVEDNGGNAVGSVSKTTTLVVAGADAGGKLEKAKKLGIKVITEAEFISMLE